MEGLVVMVEELHVTSRPIFRRLRATVTFIAV